MNKKQKQLAIKSALSDKVNTNDLIVLSELVADDYKTKLIAAMLSALGAGKKVLIVLDSNDKKAVYSARNIEGVKVAQANTINTYDIINADTLIIVKNAVAMIEEVYAQ